MQQRIAFAYVSLTKVWAEVEAEKESYVAEKGKLTIYYKCQTSLTRVFCFLGRKLIHACILGVLNVLISFVRDKKRVKPMLKDNATAFTAAHNMLFGRRRNEWLNP